LELLDFGLNRIAAGETVCLECTGVQLILEVDPDNPLLTTVRLGSNNTENNRRGTTPPVVGGRVSSCWFKH
jgi:hypothetical protein